MLSDILKGKDHRKFHSLLQAVTWFQLLLSSALLAISGNAQDRLFNALEAPGTAVTFCVSSATLLPQTHETVSHPQHVYPTAYSVLDLTNWVSE